MTEGATKLVVEAAVKFEGFREVGGGIGGFLPIGGGGFFECPISGRDAELVGRRLFLSEATDGICGAALGGVGGATPGIAGGSPPGLGGGAPLGLAGGAGADGASFFGVVSGSESYRFTPPALLRSLGIPWANNPPNCGALSIALAPPAALLG